MTIETYTLPAYWASALINGDYSGLEYDDIKAIEDFEVSNRKEDHYFACLMCEGEPYFKWSNDATNLGGDVLEYSFDVSPISSYHSPIK